MEYWNTIVTQKSWEVLQKIRKEIDFIVIGGWAAYLWAKSHKSKGIDIVIDYKELEKLKLNYELSKNDSLKKYGIKIDDIDVDIYVPFYSKLPLLEDIKSYVTKVEGFKVIKPIALLILKQAAEINRAATEKGLKDRIDIMDLLLKCEINFDEYKKILEREKMSGLRRRLIEIVSTFKETKYFDLSPRQLKLKKEALIKDLRK